jgi:hypothetical protein
MNIEMYITRNIYEVAFYSTKGLKPNSRHVRGGLVYFQYAESEELQKRRHEYLELDPVFDEVAKAKKSILRTLGRSGNHA